MTKEIYNQKITILKKWAHAYYVDDNPIATDEEYDTLYRSIEAFENQNPLHVDENSPTQRVGGVVGIHFLRQLMEHRCGVWKISLMKVVF